MKYKACMELSTLSGDIPLVFHPFDEEVNGIFMYIIFIHMFHTFSNLITVHVVPTWCLVRVYKDIACKH